MAARALYCAPFFIAALLIFIVFLYTCRRLKARGAWYLALVCLAAAIWAACEGMLYLDLDFQTKILLTRMQYLGIAPIPPLALLFGLSVFRFRYWTLGLRRVLLFVASGIVLLLVLTNPVHHLVFSRYYLIDTGPFPMLGLDHGPGWWLIVGYHYVLVALLSVILLHKVVASSGFQRQQAGVMLAAVMSVWVANAVYVSGNSPVPNMDISPIAFTLVTASMAWGFFRYNLLDILPIARAEVFRGLDDALIVLDEEDRLIEANPVAISILQMRMPEIVGREARVVFEPHPELLRIIEDTGRAETTLARDGEERIYDVRTSPLVCREGDRLGRVVALRDITRYKMAEAFMRESEARYRQIFNIAPAGIYEVDYRTGEFVSVNDAISEYSGYTHEELLAMKPIDLLTEESQVRFLERVDKILKGEWVPQTAEFDVKRKDGVEISLSINTRYVYDGEDIVGATVVAHDITERKQAEAIVRQSEQRYRDLIDSISDLIFTMDLDGRFLSVNPAMTAVFGYRENEFIGRTPEEFMGASLRPLFESDFLDGIKTEGHSQGTSRYLTRTGDNIYIEHHCSLVEPENAAPYISGTGRDVTEKLLSERQISRLQNHLHETQKIEAIGTLAGGIAHDFNNLLMAIQGHTSLLAADLAPTHPHMEQVSAIEEYIRSATDLTKQLLGFARGGKYEVRPIDINKLLVDSSSMFGRTRKEIRMHTDLQEPPPVVAVDRRQIEQVLLNLYVNASQAMPEGGDLFLETRTVTLDADFCESYQVEPGRYVKISIRDTGIGMDESVRQRIFDPFFTTKEMSRGTGLGLSSAYGIIKNHSGIIVVQSSVGLGTTFIIYLQASDIEAQQEVPVEELPVKGNETILVVDDEEMIIEVCRSMLETLGYSVIVARGGEQAIDMVKDKGDSIDLVILDMIMPGMDGGKTFDQIRMMQPGTPVLLSSGYAMNEQADDILRRGCNGFIQKPFNINDLSGNVRKVLEGTSN
jgi:PAS domain S-box-containing protein